jgi:hypothetical protein
LTATARSCGNAQESQQFLQQAAAGADPAELPWAIQAEKSMGRNNSEKAQEPIDKSLVAVEIRAKMGSSSGSCWYNIGSLQASLHRSRQAWETF